MMKDEKMGEIATLLRTAITGRKTALRPRPSSRFAPPRAQLMLLDDFPIREMTYLGYERLVIEPDGWTERELGLFANASVLAFGTRRDTGPAIHVRWGMLISDPLEGEPETALAFRVNGIITRGVSLKFEPGNLLVDMRVALAGP